MVYTLDYVKNQERIHGYKEERRGEERRGAKRGEIYAYMHLYHTETTVS
jgi:hypothetical protein